MSLERYHGSPTRALAYRMFQPIGRRISTLAKRFRQSPDAEVPPEVAALLQRARELSDRGDWNGALASTRAAAEIVERVGGRTLSVGAALVRLGDCRRGLRLMAPPLHLENSASKEWNGEDLAGRTIVVCQRTASDMGAPLRLARFVAQAERRADRCIVIVEARLVPLFQRSFPRAEVREMKGRRTLEACEGALITSLERLAAEFVTDWASIDAAFVPLRPNEDLVAEFKSRYRAQANGPIIGVTWGSRNGRKETPSLSEWARLIQSSPATFVSLQYGPIAAALRKLRRNRPVKLIHDPTVDQLVDMDRFAAQIASLDAVVSISNTATHLAGALGVPGVIIGGDRFKGQFPLVGTASGWYSRSIQVRRENRSWGAVVDEAGLRLQEVLSAAT